MCIPSLLRAPPVLRASEGSFRTGFFASTVGSGDQARVVRLVCQSFLLQFVGNLQINIKTNSSNAQRGHFLGQELLVGLSLGCDLHEAAFSVGITMLLSLSPYLLDL